MDNKIESYSGFDNQIIKINDSTNIIDVIVKEGKQLTVPISDGIQVMIFTNQILNEIKNIACQN